MPGPAVTPGQERGEALVSAGDECSGHRNQDLVSVGRARPCRVASRIRKLDLGLLGTGPPGVADLALGCRAATSLDQGRRLLQNGEPVLLVFFGDRWLAW